MLYSIILGALTIAITIMIQGIALAHMWEWFIIPIFHVSTITYGQAVGFMLFFSLLIDKAGIRQRTPKDDKLFTEELFRRFMSVISMTAFVFLVGWSVHKSM